MRYCFMRIYLHSDSISPWCVGIFRSAHFYWDISGPSGVLLSHPLNHLSFGLSFKEFGCLYAFGCHRDINSDHIMCICQEQLGSDAFKATLQRELGSGGIESGGSDRLCLQHLTLLLTDAYIALGSHSHCYWQH